MDNVQNCDSYINIPPSETKKSEVFDFAFIPKLYKRGTVVVKALCYKPEIVASRPDEVK
jgi:hypothetical protein